MVKFASRCPQLGFLGLYYTLNQPLAENERLRLAALGTVNDMIEKDRIKQMKVMEAIRFVEGLPNDESQLLEQFGTGKTLYYSNSTLADVGRHYEHIGAMVKLGYVDLDLIFEVNSFPDDF